MESLVSLLIPSFRYVLYYIHMKRGMEFMPNAVKPILG